MPGLALKLLGVWSWIRSAGAAALKWAFASATHLLLVALALALGWGVWERRQARHWQANAVKLFAGWKADRERAAAAQAAWLAKLKENADGAEQAHSDMDRGSGDRLAAYAAAHRLPAGPADGSAVPAQGASAGIPGLPAPDAVVASLRPADQLTISVADWTACDADYSYALAAHLWAQGLNKDK